MDETDAQQQPYWPELEELARPARERRRLAPETRSRIIVSLCQRAPLSVKDLSVLLDRSEAYIGDAIRPLVNTGALTFLYPDQPRHPRQKYMAASGVQVDLSGGGLVTPDTVIAPPPRDGGQREDETGYRSLPTMGPSITPVPEPEAPGFPNRLTNFLYVVLVGVILGLTNLSFWWLLAAAAGLALAWLHIFTDSGQFRQFRSLDPFHSREGPFLLLKAAVTSVEIVAVFLVVRVIAGLV